MENGASDDMTPSPGLKFAKSRVKTLSNIAGRTELNFARATRQQARRITTQAVKSGRALTASGGNVQAFKQGIENMARMKGATNEQMLAIKEMDAEKLDKMWNDNEAVFDLFFDYEGFEDSPLGITRKYSDYAEIDELIETYAKYFS
jgi:hypothetical protein